MNKINVSMNEILTNTLKRTKGNAFTTNVADYDVFISVSPATKNKSMIVRFNYHYKWIKNFNCVTLSRVGNNLFFIFSEIDENGTAYAVSKKAVPFQHQYRVSMLINSPILRASISSTNMIGQKAKSLFFTYLWRTKSMNNLQKKNRLQSGNSGDDKRKTYTVKSVTHEADKIKCVVATKELNAHQRSAIKRIYCESHSRRELVSGLKALQFCTYVIAVKSLVEQRLIFTNDYYSLIEE